MNNLTKMRIEKSSNEIFEAFVNPKKIGNFWFSTSSERWEKGKTITIVYKEYNAVVDIKIIDIEVDKKIVFQWGSNGEGHIVTILLIEESASTIVEVTEEGFNEAADDFLEQIIDNKEGWVFMLTCLKGYLEFGVNKIRGGLVK
ncbi:SRPBCC domain-containing protein [Ureibacillus composti]|nr:SRPBCC domain-containing protein [Ureibacillus composti]